MTPERPLATTRAFDELRDVVIARSGAEGFRRVLDALSAEARAPFASDDPDARHPDELWIEALNAADDRDREGDGALALAVGHARADALVPETAPGYAGDALRFLREESGRFYQGRTSYGASSVEVAPAKAIVRLVVPEHFARRLGDAPNRGPVVAHGFLERAVEIVSGHKQSPRYVGHAPRIDARFDRPMVNLVFEFDLSEE